MYITTNSTLTKVPLASSAYRNASGAVSAVPAIDDGNKTVVCCNFMGASYQFLQLQYNFPFDMLECTMKNEGKVNPTSLSVAGKMRHVDINSFFTVGKIITLRFFVPRTKGQVAFNTSAPGGVAFRFYEVSAYRVG